MISRSLTLTIAFLANPSHGISCDVKCAPEHDLVCGFDALGTEYTMFPGVCAMKRFIACNKVELTATPLYFCIKSETKRNLRKFYQEESCPVFCPQYYNPICAASSIRSYVYRTFTNACQMDMLNCRGTDGWGGYVEVPLSFCPRHGMRNIFKDQIIANNLKMN